MEKKSLEDWTLEKDFKGVNGVVDVSSFGGPTKEYQIKLDRKTGRIRPLHQPGGAASGANNSNGGGSFIEEGTQQINVQSLGLYRSVSDIENTVVNRQTE